ncbi:MAG: hypothetical protein KBD16_04435, partial [Candidatus Pacebacteria bacterium]|nr:hypothetical protein [Candidatus Paceibacterota bacterium]
VSLDTSREWDTGQRQGRKALSPGIFRIVIWGSPTADSGGGHDLGHPTAWGMGVFQSHWWGPSNKGVSIINPDDGKQIAVLVDDSLYVNAPLAWHESLGGPEIFGKILEEVVAEWTLSPAERALREAARKAEERKRSRKTYVDQCAQRLQVNIRTTQRTVESGRMQVEDLETRLVKSIRETVSAERSLAQLMAFDASDTTRFEQEYDKLLETHKVIDVSATPQVIKIFTDTLYCVDPRTEKRHEIGKFRIDIYIEGGVRWFNLDRQVNAHSGGMQAPHVFNDGHACLGNASEIFPQLIASYEFAAAAMVAIQFIESVNINDQAGMHIDKWPLAPETTEEAVVVEEAVQPAAIQAA